MGLIFWKHENYFKKLEQILKNENKKLKVWTNFETPIFFENPKQIWNANNFLICAQKIQIWYIWNITNYLQKKYHQLIKNSPLLE